MMELVTAVLVYSGSKVGDGVLGKMGEDLHNRIVGKFPLLSKQFANARKFPEKANVQSLAQELEEKTKEDNELNKLVTALGQELKKRDAKIDNKKIVYGNDYSGKFTSQSMHFGNINYGTREEEVVKKNDC